jgi:PilZ domain-containing protein
MEDDLKRRKPQRAKKRTVEHHGGDNHNEAQTIERRVHPRVPVSWPVRLWVDGSSIAGRTVDVSEQGLCVVLSAPPAHIDIGHSYRLDIIMGPKHEVSVNVEVRYLADAVVGLRTKQRLKLV